MPVYVCQLPQEQQDEIRKMLKAIHLSDFNGNPSDFEKCHGMSLKKAIQDGMDSKISDLDYLMVAYMQEYVNDTAKSQYHFADAAVIATILNEAIGRTIYPIADEIEDNANSDDEWER